MHTRNTALAALALTILMLAVSGCGSNTKTQASAASATSSTAAATTTAASDTTSTESTPQGHRPADAAPQFKARVEAICAQRNHAMSHVANSIETAKDLQRVMAGRMAVEKTTLKALRKLSVPASLKEPWQQFTEFRESLIKAENILAREGLKKDQGTEIQAFTLAQQEMAAVAKRAGFTTCTQA